MSKQQLSTVTARRSRLLWLERALYGVGAFSLLLLSYFGADAAISHQAAFAQNTLVQDAPAHASPETKPSPAKDSEVIGRLEIPGLNLTVPILSDYDPASLRRGVGHIRGTANAGGLGNFVLAGHRDTFLRPLRHIAAPMVIKVVIKEGTYEYVTDTTEVVDPDNLAILDIHNTPELTLITCYPFDFVGAAPHRFIVHAHLTSASPRKPL